MKIFSPVALKVMVRALLCTLEDTELGEEGRRRSMPALRAGCFAHSSALEWASLYQLPPQHEQSYFAGEGQLLAEVWQTTAWEQKSTYLMRTR